MIFLPAFHAVGTCAISIEALTARIAFFRFEEKARGKPIVYLYYGLGFDLYA